MEYADTHWRVGFAACAMCRGVGHIVDNSKKEPTA